jgi:hypothetical protein
MGNAGARASHRARTEDGTPVTLELEQLISTRESFEFLPCRDTSGWNDSGGDQRAPAAKPGLASGRGVNWGGWGRTSNLPVNSRALCRLSYTPRKDGR